MSCKTNKKIKKIYKKYIPQPLRSRNNFLNGRTKMDNPPGTNISLKLKTVHGTSSVDSILRINNINKNNINKRKGFLELQRLISSYRARGRIIDKSCVYHVNRNSTHQSNNSFTIDSLSSSTCNSITALFRSMNAENTNEMRLIPKCDFSTLQCIYTFDTKHYSFQRYPACMNTSKASGPIIGRIMLNIAADTLHNDNRKNQFICIATNNMKALLCKRSHSLLGQVPNLLINIITWRLSTWKMSYKESQNVFHNILSPKLKTYKPCRENIASSVDFTTPNSHLLDFQQDDISAISVKYDWKKRAENLFKNPNSIYKDIIEKIEKSKPSRKGSITKPRRYAIKKPYAKRSARDEGFVSRYERGPRYFQLAVKKYKLQRPTLDNL